MPIPLARKPSGAFTGSRTAPVQVEIFLDVQCPYSAKAWPVIRQLAAHYGEAIGLSVNLMVLSNHRQSWDVTLGLFGLAGGDDARFLDFLTFLYQQQERFWNGQFADRTHNDLKSLVGELGREFDGTDPERMAELLNDTAVFAAAKEPGRYAALCGVWSTPTIFINNSERSDLGSSSALGDWQTLIDPLLA